MTQGGTIQARVEFDHEVARPNWESLHESGLGSSPFTDFRFLQTLSQSFGWKLCFVFWDDAIAACFFVRKRGFVRDIVVPPFSPYSAILLSKTVPEEERKNQLAHLFAPIAGLPTSRLISLGPGLTPYAGDVPQYDRRSKRTYWVPCASPEEAAAKFSESTRRVIKRSGEEYLVSSNAVPLENISCFVTEGYRVHGKKAALNSLRLSQMAATMSTFTFAHSVGLVNKATGEFEAGIVFLIRGNMAWYWFAGSIRGPAMTILVSRSLTLLQERGVTILDFMGANTTGITEFKRRFGGDLVEYVHYTRENALNVITSMIGRFLRHY